MSGPHSEQDRTPPQCNREPRSVCGDDCPVHGYDIVGSFADAFDALLAETIALEARLPDGMKHCTIQFIECPAGHGRLTAANWVRTGCPWCRIAHLEADV